MNFSFSPCRLSGQTWCTLSMPDNMAIFFKVIKYCFKQFRCSKLIKHLVLESYFKSTLSYSISIEKTIVKVDFHGYFDGPLERICPVFVFYNLIPPQLDGPFYIELQKVGYLIQKKKRFYATAINKKQLNKKKIIKENETIKETLFLLIGHFQKLVEFVRIQFVISNFQTNYVKLRRIFCQRFSYRAPWSTWCSAKA